MSHGYKYPYLSSPEKRREIDREYVKLRDKTMKATDNYHWDMQGVQNWETACANVENRIRARIGPGYAIVYSGGRRVK